MPVLALAVKRTKDSNLFVHQQLRDHFRPTMLSSIVYRLLFAGTLALLFVASNATVYKFKSADTGYFISASGKDRNLPVRVGLGKPAVSAPQHYPLLY